MSRLNDFRDHFNFFAYLGTFFEARYLKPMWREYPACESDNWEACQLFTTNHAFARQGAKPDFPHAAADVIKKLREKGQSITDRNTAHLAWSLFRTCLQDKGLNHAKNPLCPLGTRYSTEKGPKATTKKSIIEFLNDIWESGREPNIVALAKSSLQLDQVEAFHSRIQGVNGVGPKIASLFLRDVGTQYDVTCSKARHLLQPVDIWIRRAFEILTSQDSANSNGTVEIQRWILEESIKCDVRPEAINEGMWYFGSQVAGSGYRLERTLNNLDYARTLLSQHMKALQDEVSEWQRSGSRH